MCGAVVSFVVFLLTVLVEPFIWTLIISSLLQESSKSKLFEWVDGPLVQAMKGGAMFLIDEISLADDSVLERLNSVLEPEQTLLLAEKGGEAEEGVEQVVAEKGFQVFATMNPGGDFGKKEVCLVYFCLTATSYSR